MSLFDVTTDTLAASLNLRELRHEVVASNIANADTPGYKAKKVDFEDALAQAVNMEKMAGSIGDKDPNDFVIGPGAVSRAKADVYDDPDGAVSNDGNTVDLEKQMATMQENTILYKAALRLINKKLAAIAYASTEGGLR